MTKISNQYSLTNILTADLANSRLGINNVSPTVALDVTGAGKFSGALTGTTATFSGTGVGLATFGGSASGSVNSLIVNNTSNTASSDAVLTTKVAGASGGNPHSRYEITGVTTWFAGVNNASSDAYAIAGDAGFGSATYLSIATTGAATFSGNVTIDKSSPLLQLNAPTGTAGEYRISNGVGTTHWSMYSVTGGSNTQGNWALYSVGKTGGAGAVIEVTPAGNVGIGTSSPAWMFEVNKDTSSSSFGQYPAISVNNPNASGYSAYYFFSGATNKGGLEYSNSTNAMLIYSNGAERMRINAAGNVGIGTTSPGSTLTVVGSITFTPSSFLVGSSTATDGNSLTLQSATTNYYVRFRGSDGSDQGGLYQRTLGGPIKINNGFEVATLVGSGNRAVYSNATGELTNSSSDFTLKTNIVPITYGLNTILKLNPITYNWINTEDLGIQKEIGFIAQEVEIEIPELIGKNSNGKLSLDYPKMVAILTKAIQELSAKVSLLENK